MLRTLDCAALNRLHERAAGTELPARGEPDIHLAVRHVLDVFLQVQLHDRIAARRTEHVGGGDRHDVIGRGLALAFLLGGLRGGLVRPEHPAGPGDHRRGEASRAYQFQEVPAFGRLQLVIP